MQGISAIRLGSCCFLVLLWAGPEARPAHAAPPQLSLSAYRALGQTDLRQNGVNMVGAGTLSSPQGVAVDRDGHLYVADTFNHRVLAWASVTGFQNGDSATIVLGQPSPRQSNPYGIGPKGFSFPMSLSVDPSTGNLYVADFGNSRVLRFPKPFANLTGVEPDAVYGQPDFATHSANSSGVTAHTINQPRGVSVDGQGNLWVADTGNNRILRFPAAVLDATNPDADFALGQPDLHSASANHNAAVSASGFNQPAGLAFDSQNSLYVADYLNT